MTESMPERGVTVADVLATLAAPDYEFPGNQRGTVESYGRTADGTLFYVVTAKERTFVITVALVRALK